MLAVEDLHFDVLRIRAFPLAREVVNFVDAHDRVFVVEQNRDAQLRTMLVTEQEFDPAKLEPILHYDGTPITARFITEAIAERVRADNVQALAPQRAKGLAA